MAGRTVALAPAANPKRKTRFDLVAVQTPKGWINIDSQAPNAVVDQGLRDNQIKLPGLAEITLVRPETTFQQARFDFFGSSGQQPFFLEVKGVTLWHPPANWAMRHRLVNCQVPIVTALALHAAIQAHVTPVLDHVLTTCSLMQAVNIHGHYPGKQSLSCQLG